MQNIKQHLEQLAADPSNLRALDALEKACAQRGALPIYVRFLLQQAEQVSSTDAKALLLVRAGELTGLRLGDNEQAQALIREALGLSEAELVQTEARVSLLSLRGEWAAVLNLHHQQMEAATSDGEKAWVLCRMGRVYRDRTGDNSNAMKAFQTAFKLDRDCLEALGAARDIYAEVGNWKLVRQLLQLEFQQLQSSADKKRLAEVLTHLGDVLRQHLDNPETAAACYSNALESDGFNMRAREGLAALGYEVPPMPTTPPAPEEDLLALFGLRPLEAAPTAFMHAIPRAPEPEDEPAQEAAPAEEEDEGLVAIDMSDEPAAEEPAAVEEPVAAVEEPVAAVEEPVAAEVELDVAEVAGDAPVVVEEPDADVADVVVEEPVEEAAPVAAQEPVAAEEPVAVAEEAAPVVSEEPVAVAAEPEEVLIAAEDEPAAAEPVVAEPVVAEPVVAEPVVVVAPPVAVAAPPVAAVSGGMAAMSRPAMSGGVPALSRPMVSASSASQPSVAARPASSSSVPVPAAVSAPRGGDQNWRERAAVLVEQASGGGAESGGQWAQALRLHALHGGEPLAVLRRAVESAPDAEVLYEGLRGRLSSKDEWREVIGVLSSAVGSAPRGGAALRRQLGRVHLYELGELDKALEVAQALVAEGEAGSLAQEAADARTASGGAWRRLQQELESRHASEGQPKQTESVYTRMGEVARALGQEDRRLDALKRLSQEVPHAHDARRTLKEIYRGKEKWADYVAVTKLEAEHAQGDEKKALLWELVGLYRDQLKQDAMVVLTMQQLLEVEPGSLAVLDGLAEQYDRMRRYPDLVGVLQKRAEAATSQADRVSVFARIAALYLEKFSNQAEAIKAYEEVLALDPGHAEAIARLKDMYEKRREWDKLVDLHEREIAGLAAPEEKAARYKEVADAAIQKMRRADKGAELWRKVLLHAPGDLDALTALENLYEREKLWDELAEVGEQRFERLTDRAEQLKLADKLGRLYTERVKRPEAAVRAWKRVLSVEPDNRKAQDALKKLLIDGQDWDGLDEVFGALGDHAGHVKVLETLVGTVKEDAVKVDLLFRSAGLWRDKLGQTDRAVKALERVLQLDPSSERAARELAPIYEAAGDPKKLAQSLEIVLAHLDEAAAPAQAREVLSKLARLYEQKLKNAEGSFDYYARAFALEDVPARLEAGEVEAVFEDLERVARALGAWDEVVGAYEAKLSALDAGGFGASARELRLRLGRTLHGELGRSQAALGHYEAVLADFPGEERALVAEEEIFQKLGDMDRLMGVCDRRLALTEEPQERIAIFGAKAVILEEHHQDYAAAVECYRAIVDLEPAHVGALESLHRLYEVLEDYPSLAEVIRREVALVEGRAAREVKAVDGRAMGADEAAAAGVVREAGDLGKLLDLKVQLGVVCAGALGDEGRREALLLLQDVLAVDPNREQALELMEGISEDPMLSLQVADILEPLYAEQALWEKLVTAREVQLVHTEERGARVAKLLSIGEVLAERVSDLGRAFEAYGRALTEDATSEEARGRLEAIAEAAELWDALVTLMEDITASLQDEVWRKEYQTRVALAIEQKLGDAPRAQQAWRAVLDLDAQDEQALLHLEALYQGGEQWNELDEIYDRRLELLFARQGAGEEVAAELEGLRFQQALLHEEMLGDSAGAIDLYRAILEAAPQNLRARQSLDRLLAGEGRFDEQAENLERQLALVGEVEERLSLQCRLAALKETQLYQVEEAIALYGQVLSVDPGYEAALSPLDRLVRSAPEHQAAVSAILEPLYREGQAWDKLVELHELQLANVEEVPARVALLHVIAGLQEQQLQDAASAFGTLARALAEDVNHAQTMDGLYRIAEATGGWEVLGEVLEGRIAEAADDEVACGLHMRVAAIRETYLGDVDAATAHYGRVLELRPDHMGAIDNLERIFAALEQWGPLVDILLRKAQLTEDEAAKRELLYRAATLFEEMLQQADAAIQVYEQVLEIEAADAVAIENLERLYLGAARWAELIELYQRKLRFAQEPSARRELFFQIGAVQEMELQDAYQAIEAFRAALELDNNDVAALENLSRLYTSTEQWHDLLDALERRVALAQDPSQALEMRHEIGLLWEQFLREPTKAVEVYRAILADDPTHEATAQALEGMINRGEEQVSAAEVLKPIYQSAGKWSQLVALYEILVAAGEDPVAQAALLVEIGQLQELRLNDPGAAFGAYGRALALTPEDEGVCATLERLAGELQQWEALVELMEERLTAVSDMGVARGLALRLGRILEEEVFDPARAIEKYRSALDLEPTDRGAMGALDRLYEKTARWAELSEILQEEIHHEQDEDARVAYQMRQGTLLESALGEVERAIAVFQDVLAARPGLPEALAALEGMFAQGHAPLVIGEMLEPVYREQGEWAKLVDVYLAQLDVKEGAEERFAHLHQIAGLYLEKLQDQERAFLVLGNALKERPSDEPTRGELERLAGEIGTWDQVAGFYHEAYQAAEGDPDTQKQLMLGIARVMDERLADTDSAEQAYLSALEMDPSELSALEALDRIYSQGQRWPQLAQVLRREIALCYEDDKVIELSYRLGVLCEQQLGDLDSAVETYQSILNLQPLHPEALLALENIFLAREEWEPLFNIYERQAERQADSVEGSAEVYTKMAALADQMLQRPQDAIDLWNRVLELRSEDVLAMQSLAELYHREGRFGDLVAILEREASVTTDPARKVELYSLSGQFWHQELMNEDKAIESWRRVLELDPTNAAALAACRELYERAGQYENLVEVIERSITLDSVSPQDLLGLYVQLGTVQGEVLGRPKEAIEAWQAVLSLDGGHWQALDALEQLFTDQAQWEACVDVLARKVEVLQAQGDEARAGEQIDLLLRIADLWESKIGQPDQAISAYEAVTELDPGHMQASQALEGLYTKQGAWENLVNLYLVRREYLEDPIDRMEIMRSAARIYEDQLKKDEEAFLVYCSAFMENYQDEQTAQDLDRLARATGQWETLVTLYGNVLAEVGDGPEAMGLHMKIAKWQAEELHNPDEAIANYRRALEIAPDSVEVLAALEQIYEQEQRWQELVTVLELRADLTVEDDARVELYRKIGEIQSTRANDLPLAIDAYKTLLRIDETDKGALEALERIYEVTGAWTDLIDVLQRQAAVLFEPAKIVGIKHRVATLWEEQVGSVERAVEAHRDVLMVDQSHAESRLALERLYQHLERWEDLLDVYDLGLSLAGSGAEQIGLYQKMAQVYENELRDQHRAIECYGRVLLLEEFNLVAIEQLERLYQQIGAWDELVQTMERHVQATREPVVQVELLAAIAQVQRDNLQDLNQAIHAYRRLLAVDARNTDALYDVAALYEQTGDWESCLAAYAALVPLLRDQAALVELHHRMGRIREENLSDPQGAEGSYKDALRLDAGHKPSLDALRGIYERREDWVNVIAMLRQEEEFTRDLEDKAALLCRIGRIYEDRLQDDLRALDYYEQTIELSPENLGAAEPLSNMYLRERRWARAQPLLDLLVRKRAQDRTNPALFQLYFNLGQVCEELAQPERALKEYNESYELNPNHLPTLLGMGRLFYKRGDHDRALKVYQTITRYHGHALSEKDMVELYLRSGQIQLAANDLRGGQEMFEAVLSLQNNHAEAIAALIDLHTRAQNWHAAVEYRRAQLPSLQDPFDRFTAFKDLGDIYGQQLGDPQNAILSYGEALQMQPDSMAILRKMLDIYTQNQVWDQAVLVLNRITDLQQDPAQKAKFLYTIAVLYRDSIGDPQQAVEYFNRALDADVNMLKSFEAIDRILTQERDWKGLEKSYRRMLHRVKDADLSTENEGLKFLLWRNLGEIFRTRQNNPAAAVEAYRIAVGMRPDDAQLHEILADLYERTGSHPEEAIKEHRHLIAENPFRIPSYRALFNTYMKTGRYDEAWCMASALTFLQSAVPDEQKFYQEYLPASPPTPTRSLSPDQWKLLYHESQDMLTSNIMAVLALNMRKDYYAFDHKTWEVHKRKDLIDLNQPLPFSQIYQWTARTLSLMQVPDVYLKRDQTVPIRNGNLEPPGLLVSPTLFQGLPDRELTFHIAKSLTLARPEHYLGAGFFPTENLKLLFLVALQFTRPEMNFGLGNAQPVMDAMNRLRKVPPPELLRLRQYVEAFLQSGANPNLSAWLKALDYTSDRVALLLCGDLITTANAIKNEQAALSKLTPKERIKEVVLFSISDAYFDMRKQLGIALGQ